MKVKELIDELKKYDGNTVVVAPTYSLGEENLEITDVSQYDEVHYNIYDETRKEYIYIKGKPAVILQ